MVIGGGDYCAIIRKVSDYSVESERKYSLITICDEIGNEWSTKQMQLQPHHASMNDMLIIVSDHRNVYIHVFDPFYNNRRSGCDFSSSRFANGPEHMFDIQNKSLNPSKTSKAYDVNYDTTGPQITDITSTLSLALFAMEDKNILIFSLPNIARLNKVCLNCDIPKTIQVNCNASKFSVIDSKNVLQIFDLEEDSTKMIGMKSYLDSSSVRHAWAMLWSREDPDSIAVFDKAALLEINLKENVEKEVVFEHCNGYLMDFSDLEISLVLLDDIMLHPDAISTYCTFSVPSKILEEARFAISQESDLKVLQSTFSHLSQKKLWKLMANEALMKLDLVTAEKAFVLCEDYAGIQFIEKLSLCDDKDLQKADILKFTGKYIDAEKKYISMNRFDLAILMNLDLGEWMRVKALLDEGEIEKHVAQNAWLAMADQYVKRHQFQVAAEVS